MAQVLFLEGFLCFVLVLVVFFFSVLPSMQCEVLSTMVGSAFF